jgi:hypothetical protein
MISLSLELGVEVAWNYLGMIRPEGSTITFSGATAATIYLGNIQFSFVSEKFDRPEFSNERLRAAPNTDGSQPQFVTLFGGKVAQLVTSCGIQTSRSVLPDDANVDNIKKRMDIRRYTIKTIECPIAAATALSTVAQDHEVFIQRFEAHLAKVQMSLSYDALVALQAEDFEYLETTGLTMDGQVLLPFGGSTQSNCLIRQYIPEPQYEIPNNSAGTSSEIYLDFTLVIDQIAIVPASSADFGVDVGGTDGEGEGGSGSTVVQRTSESITAPTYSVDITAVHFIESDTTANNIVITLPAATTINDGLDLTVQKKVGGLYTVTVQTSGIQTLSSGGTSFVLTEAQEAWTFTSKGSGGYTVS